MLRLYVAEAFLMRYDLLLAGTYGRKVSVLWPWCVYEL